MIYSLGNLHDASVFLLLFLLALVVISLCAAVIKRYNEAGSYMHEIAKAMLESTALESLRPELSGSGLVFDTKWGNVYFARRGLSATLYAVTQDPHAKKMLLSLELESTSYDTEQNAHQDAYRVLKAVSECAEVSPERMRDVMLNAIANGRAVKL